MAWLPRELKIYRALLTAYPAEFRHEYADEMERLFEERLRREPRVRVWLDTLSDLALSAATEHLHTLAGDLRHGARIFAKAPGVTLIALLAMTLGIGATTAVFSLMNAVLIRPLPYGGVDRLVYMWRPNPSIPGVPRELSPTFENVIEWRKQCGSFASITELRQASFRTASDTFIGGARVAGNFFQTLNAPAELGRTIDADDDQPGHERVAVISRALWMAEFGGDPGAIGKALSLDGRSYRVIGVMPERFAFPHKNDYPDASLNRSDVWIPLALALTPEQVANWGPSAAIGRLRPGATLQRAQSETEAVVQATIPTLPPGMQGFQSLLVPFIETEFGRVRPLLWILMGAVLLVLLIASSNVANLLLARAAGRMHEMGVRSALGAARARLLRQMLTESAMLGVGGAALGTLAAFAILRAVAKLNPGDIPRLEEASLDGRVLIFTLGVSLLTGLLAGVAPALFASRVRVTELLRQGGGRGSVGGAARARNALVMIEVALSVALLTGAGLLMRSYLNLQNQDNGYAASTLTMRLAITQNGRTRPQMAKLFREINARVSTLPGVQAAGAIDALPLVSHESLGFLEVEGYANRPLQTANTWNVSGDYFRAMQIRLMAGRFLNDADVDAQPKVVAVSQSFAKLYFDGRPAVGARIKIGGDGSMQVPWSTVVGVVADVRHSGLERPPAPTVYAASQFADTLAVRSSLPPDAIAVMIRKSLHNLDPTIALADLRTMDDRISEAASRRRFQTALLAAFAVIAVALALAGLYGLLSYAVRQRTGEIGLRIALGASRADVVGMIVRQGLALVALGLAVGLAAAMVLSSLITSLLYGVRASDLATLVAVPVFILAVGALACAIPAWKAAKVDPATALRLTP